MSKANWVFGYGSLMWAPGFHAAEAVKAHLAGYTRRFCLKSIRYRGTRDAPGLVLALDETTGAECCGVALRIPVADHDKVMEYIRGRELVTDAYREAILPLELEDGRRVDAYAYVTKPDHWQYAGDLALREQAQIIARSVGAAGPNAEYLFNTVKHLQEIGVSDTLLDELSRDVRRMLDEHG